VTATDRDDHDHLRLQRLNSTNVELDDITTASAAGHELVRYVLEDLGQVTAGRVSASRRRAGVGVLAIASARAGTTWGAPADVSGDRRGDLPAIGTARGRLQSTYASSICP
jgi:hypothetical protein